MTPRLRQTSRGASPAHCPRCQGLAAQESLRGYDGAASWDSASWNLLDASPLGWGKCLSGGPPLQNYPRELPGEAAGHQVLLIPPPETSSLLQRRCWRRRSHRPRSSWLPVTGAREAVRTRGLGAGRLPSLRGLQGGDAPCEPHAREAAGCAGAC